MQRFISEYNLGDFVVLKTDIDKLVRIITAIEFRPGIVNYQLSSGVTYTWHIEMEFERVGVGVPE